ncbi:MAG: PKD domain-containing protein [Acidimicrobiales bacterium]
MATVAKQVDLAHFGNSRRTRMRSDGSATAPRQFRLFALAVAVPLLTLLAVPVTSVGATRPAAAGSTYYAIGKPLCKPPKPGYFSCYAIRRVEVKKGTPGAKPFKLAAGATASIATSGRTATIGPAGGLTPYDLANAYDYDSAAPVTGQTVAIIDAYNDPKINSNLQTFDTHYGLIPCSISNGCLKVVNQSGGSTLPPNDTSGWSGEETLDVETVHSVCENCKIILLEVTTPSISNFDVAVNEAAKLKATEISNSYGGAESSSTPTGEAAYNHPGIVITASAGDDGYYSFDTGGANQPNAPASFATVVAVGGTSLYLGQTATRQSESVWNDNGPRDFWGKILGPLGATGGGCSTLIPAPGWQSGMSVWPSTGCATHRLVADIAVDADYLTGFDIYDTYVCGSACGTPGWSTVGGTSLSSPIIASMFGLAGGAEGVAYPALTLYGHLGSSSLYDVTSGGNGYCDGEGAAACGDPNTGGEILDCDYPATGSTPSPSDRACDALAGYDGPTGVGTPNGLGAFAKTGPTAAVGGPASVTSGTTNFWTATTADPFPGGTVTSYTWNWGDGSTPTVTTTDSASHDYLTGGSDTITLTVTDNYGQTGAATYPVEVS